MENKIKFAIQLYRQSQDLSAICRKKHEKNFSEMNKIAGASRTSAICEIIYKCTFIPACNKHFFVLIDQKKLFGNDPYCFALLSVILFLGKRGFLEPLSPTRGS